MLKELNKMLALPHLTLPYIGVYMGTSLPVVVWLIRTAADTSDM